MAKTFGEGKSERANEYFSLFVNIKFALGVVLAALSIYFIRPIAAALGVEGDMLENAVVYARIILLALPFAKFFVGYDAAPVELTGSGFCV